MDNTMRIYTKLLGLMVLLLVVSVAGWGSIVPAELSVRPTVTINQAVGQADPTNQSPIHFTVVFSKSVKDFTSRDVTITGGLPSIVTGSGRIYDVAVSGMEGNGTVTATLAAGVAHDAVGNSNKASTSTDNSVTYDFTPPTVISVNRLLTSDELGSTSASADGQYTNAASVTWRVTFSELIVASSVSSGDFTLRDLANSITGESITSITPTSGVTTIIDVTANTGTGSGTLRLDVLPAATIFDLVGNDYNSTFNTGETYIIDKSAPTISISAPSALRTQNGPVSYVVTYGEADNITLAIADVILNRTGTANGTLAVSGSGTTNRTVTISDISGNGTLGISLVAGTASDFAGNIAIGAGPSARFTVDNTAPTVSISAPSALRTRSGPISYTISYGGANAVTLVVADVTLNKTGTANGIVAVSGSGTSTRTVTISGITGNGTLGISLVAGTAGDSVGNMAAGAGPSARFTVDNTAPTVGISAPSALLTKSGPITYTITYGGASNISLSAADVILNKTGTANGTIGESGSGTTSRTVTITGITGNGTLGISIVANTASDLAGNRAVGAGPSTRFTVDNTAPTVSIGAPSALRTRNGPITYTITFAGANIVSLTAANITLNKFGTVNGTVNVSGSGTTSRTVTISSITGNGTLGIALAAGTASDNVGNLAVAVGPSATFIVDNTAPKVSISAPSALLTRNGPITYTITYTGADIVTLAAAKVILNRTGTAIGTVGVVSGTGTTSRTVRISGITGDGTLGISIIAGTASDNTGNVATGAGPSATFLVANIAPVLVISAPSATLTNSGPITYTITYGGASNITLAAADVTLNKTGTANGTVGVSGSGTTSRTVTISSITGDGTLGISIAAGTAADSALNLAAAAGPSATFKVDNTAPILIIGAPSAPLTRNGPITYTITYSGANTVMLAATDVTLNKTGTANGIVGVSGSGVTSRTVTISSIIGDGTLGISIAAGTASDIAAHTAAAAGPSATFDVDNTAPFISIGAPSVPLTRHGPVHYTISYADADLVTLVAANVILNSTGTANGTIGVSGTGTASRTVTISNITGDGKLGISIVAGTASDTAGNTTVGAGPSVMFTIDNTATISIGAPSKSHTKSGPVTYTISYGGVNNITLALADVTLNFTGTANGTIGVSGSGSTNRTVTISGITGNGTLGISIAAGTASDIAGNIAPAAGPSTTFIVDNLRGEAAGFGAFGGGAGMTNSGTLTIIYGDIGTTGVSTMMTGFHDSTGDSYTETPLNIGAVTGRIYTDAPPPVIFASGGPYGGNAVTKAIADAAAADALNLYNYLAGLPAGSLAGAGELGGLTLAPGTYTSATSFKITNGDLTLSGNADDIWVFQMGTSLTVGAPGTPRTVTLAGGAQAKNVFWQVGSAARIEDNCYMVGTIIAQAGVTISTAGQGGITTLEGRALGLNASVTMVNTIIDSR